jgi:outer membrane protein assembly factor BamB
MSGRVLWHADLPGYPERWIYTSPTIADGTVYVGAKAGYAAYDLGTGARQWYTKIDNSDAWSCYAGPQVYRDLLIVLVQRRGLIALDRQSGAVVWERKLGVDYPYAQPVVAGDLVVSGGDSPNLHWFKGDAAHIAVLQAHSGEIVWNQPVLPSRYPTGLMVLNGRIYATTPDGEALCYDLHSGRLYWRFQTGEDLLDMVPYRRGVRSILAAPVAFGNRMLICGCDGCLYVLNAASGACQSRTPFGSPVTAAPCLIEDGFCVGTYDGRLFCFGMSGDKP